MIEKSSSNKTAETPNVIRSPTSRLESTKRVPDVWFLETPMRQPVAKVDKMEGGAYKDSDAWLAGDTVGIEGNVGVETYRRTSRIRNTRNGAHFQERNPEKTKTQGRHVSNFNGNRLQRRNSPVISPTRPSTPTKVKTSTVIRSPSPSSPWRDRAAQELKRQSKVQDQDQDLNTMRPSVTDRIKARARQRARDLAKLDR